MTSREELDKLFGYTKNDAPYIELTSGQKRQLINDIKRVFKFERYKLIGWVRDDWRVKGGEHEQIQTRNGKE